MRIPHLFCDVAQARDNVFGLAENAMRLHFASIERRLERGRWWYGEQWSILDAYLNWVWFRVTGAGFDAGDFPQFARHDAHSTVRPSVVRALASNREVAASLAAQGLAVTFSGAGAYAPPKP